MKLKNTVSSWTMLIPSLLLNVALLGALAFFLNQLDIFYTQATRPGQLVHLRLNQPVDGTARLAVHAPTAAGAGGLDGTGRNQP